MKCKDGSKFDLGLLPVFGLVVATYIPFVVAVYSLEFQQRLIVVAITSISSLSLLDVSFAAKISKCQNVHVN